VNSQQIFNFIEQAFKKSESVLVHSVRGQTRASSIIAIYLIKKYRWSLMKTLEFLNARRPDLEIRASFIQQLQDFEARLTAQGQGPKSFTWNELSSAPGKHIVNNLSPGIIPNVLEKEELVLRNTFVNSQMGAIVPHQSGLFKKQDRVKWVDEHLKRPIATAPSPG